ncbi:MAG: peroxide stress protein YaaA [Rubrivivax sp.]|nr:peroxide stress protein YaaA [Rubrivivax sp.]
MLYLLSPAKRLDYEARLPAATLRKATEPLFVDRAAELIATMRTKSASQVASLMDLSEPLAALNVERYAAWQPQATAVNSRPALLAFDGDVYGGLQARTLKATDLNWAQQHLVILSGLYGVLRPFDRLQPYRLEMGTALRTARGADLYAYWGDLLAQHLDERLAGDRQPVLVNLASIEYARAALRPALQARVIDCVFEDWKDDQYKIISFFAKRARGLMARWAIDQRINTPGRLKGFAVDGYAFDKPASARDRLVFRRRQPPAPGAA